jgi:hypothetical protein
VTRFLCDQLGSFEQADLRFHPWVSSSVRLDGRHINVRMATYMSNSVRAPPVRRRRDYPLGFITDEAATGLQSVCLPPARREPCDSGAHPTNVRADTAPTNSGYSSATARGSPSRRS